MSGRDLTGHIRVNNAIRAGEIRVIDSDGGQIGLISVSEALKLAAERDLDLVEISPNANPPVCKILDFGKYKYQLSKRHTQKKTTSLKEIKVRPHIGEHDLDLKIKSINQFIKDGNKVRVIMFFRGREIIRRDFGMKVFDRISRQITGKFQIEQEPKLTGNSIVMVIAPRS